MQIALHLPLVLVVVEQKLEEALLLEELQLVELALVHVVLVAASAEKPLSPWPCSYLRSLSETCQVLLLVLLAHL